MQKAGGRDTREHIHEMVLPRLEQIEARHIDQGEDDSLDGALFLSLYD